MFNDREEDKENSLYNNGVRKLDDGLGRFTAIDPLWEKFRWQSPYVYGDNNPLGKTDPSGMQAEEILKAGGGAILVLAADDVTGVGVADDALIPAVGIVTLGLATYVAVMDADAGTLPPSSQVYENMEKNSGKFPEPDFKFPQPKGPTMAPGLPPNFGQGSTDRQPSQSQPASEAEHTKGKRKSTEQKHQKGETRKLQKENDKKRQGKKWQQNPNKRKDTKSQTSNSNEDINR